MTRDQQMTGEVAKKLVGAWRYVATTIDGVNKPRGNNPKGIIYYGPYGEMSVQIAPGRGRRGLSSREGGGRSARPSRRHRAPDRGLELAAACPLIEVKRPLLLQCGKFGF
jgi:hypothetical protein